MLLHSVGKNSWSTIDGVSVALLSQHVEAGGNFACILEECLKFFESMVLHETNVERFVSYWIGFLLVFETNIAEFLSKKTKGEILGKIEINLFKFMVEATFEYNWFSFNSICGRERVASKNRLAEFWVDQTFEVCQRYFIIIQLFPARNIFDWSFGTKDFADWKKCFRSCLLFFICDFAWCLTFYFRSHAMSVLAPIDNYVPLVIVSRNDRVLGRNPFY